MPQHFDIIVIGSGAGGGTLTYALAPTGKKVLLLERGGWYPREKENWNSMSVWGDLRYRNAGHWVDHTGKEFNPKQHYYVGGNTKVYGAVLFRLRERDFGPVRHVDGASRALVAARSPHGGSCGHSDDHVPRKSANRLRPPSTKTVWPVI